MALSYVLPRSTPEEQGIDSSKILSFLDSLDQHQIEFHSFMLLRNGTVAAEAWWSPYRKDLPHMLFSLSKSFTSTAIGLAVHEGLLTVEDPVIQYFPEQLPQNMDEKFKKLKVKHLLSMSTGHKEEPSAVGRPDGNWAKAFFEAPLTYEPGTHFLYNTLATYMLSVIITRLTGKTTRDYLMPRLFEPLGIERPSWATCPRGYSTGGFGLNLKTEDILKFGLLYLQKGMLNGHQIIPSAWVVEATKSQISNAENSLPDWKQGYGYQFWRCQGNAYRGDGAFGQYCIVFPEKNAVIAITSAVKDMQAVMDLIHEHLVPAFGDEKLSPSSFYPILHDRLGNLFLAPPMKMKYSPLEQKLESGILNLFDKNQSSYERIFLRLKDDKLTITLDGDRGPDAVEAGKHIWLPSTTSLVDIPGEGNKTCPILSSFTWEQEDLLLVTIRYIESPFCVTLRIGFNDEGLTLNGRINVSFGAEELFNLKAVTIE